MNKNILGFDLENVTKLTDNLNELLSNFQIYYQNLRGLHWNIKGKSFFELHMKFEELYLDAQDKIDLIAERILTLEGTPLHTFEDYMKFSRVEIGKNISNDIAAVQLIVSSLEWLLHVERNILNESGKLNDEGTNAMMSDFISEQEKTIWMMKAWLHQS